MEFLKTLSHRCFVLLPLPFAKNYLQEIPHPANHRHISQLLFSQHFRALKVYKIRQRTKSEFRVRLPHPYSKGRGKIKSSVSYPKYSKSVTEGPATQKVNLKTVVQNHNSILFSIEWVGFWVSVESAFCPRPPLQGCYQLYEIIRHKPVNDVCKANSYSTNNSS